MNTKAPPLSSGATPVQPSSAKKSTPALKPSAQSLPKSALPHQHRVKVENVETSRDTKVADIAAILGGEKPETKTHKETVTELGNVEPDTSSNSSFLDGAGDVAADTPSEVEAEAAAPAKPKLGDVTTVAELAEQLGTTQKKLYDSLEITATNGETMTLGALKDKVQDQETSVREVVQRETALHERESAVLRDQQLITAMSSDLVGKVSPELVERYQAQQQQSQAREAQQLRAAMPELADKAAFDTFRGEVVETLSGYGFRPSEMNITDHRMLVILKDLQRTKAQLKKLMEFDPEKVTDKKVPKTHKPQGKTNRGTNRSRMISNARDGTRGQKVNAIAALITGK